MKLQYHLVGSGFSSRAVRLKTLSASVIEDNLLAAAKLVGPDATGFEIKKTEWRNGIKHFVVEYTEPCADPLAEGVKWRTVKPFDLENLSDYFTPKDIAVLEKIFQDYHEVSQAEVDSIVKKAIPLSEG